MFLVGLLSWWYGEGFFSRIQMIKNRISDVLDFFSVFILIKTLFMPYKQISAGGNIDKSESWIEVLADKIISRTIGFFARISLIIIGSIAILFQLLFSFVLVVIWLVAPLAPVVCLIIYVIGWVPVWKI
jgi:hypothetical protein